MRKYENVCMVNVGVEEFNSPVGSDAPSDAFSPTGSPGSHESGATMNQSFAVLHQLTDMLQGVIGRGGNQPINQAPDNLQNRYDDRNVGVWTFNKFPFYCSMV